MLKSLVYLAALATGSLAEVVKYDWNVGWVTAAPDGFTRPVIGINGKWPNPAVEVSVGDTLIVNVHNGLVNQSTAIHWHGLFQEGSNEMDGAAKVTQCPIPPGETFKYEFKIKQSGTYWYHAHIGGQYADGLYGPFIIKDKQDPYKGKFEKEFVMTVADWYHDQVPTLLVNELFTTNNTQFRPPIPKGGLINGANNKVANTTFSLVPGKTYKFRIINTSALAGAILLFDSHKVKVIEVDGVYTHEEEAGQIYLAPAQRYSVLLEAKESMDKNFALTCVFDLNPNFANPIIGFPINTTAWLVYDSKKPLPPQVVVPKFDILDDFILKPLSNEPLLAAPTTSKTLDASFKLDEFNLPRAYFNNVTYVHQKTPTLYTVLSVGKDATNPIVYGQVNPIIVEGGQVVELVVNNLTPGHHPFHLHGHHFQTIYRGAFNSGPYKGTTNFPAIPMQRDTVIVNGRAAGVFRFKATNPGVWLFHCHLEWHVNMGLIATVIEAPLAIQKTIDVPKEHFEICKEQCLPTEGNAAGNTKNHTDLTGANTQPLVPDKGAIYVATACSATSGPTVTEAPKTSTTYVTRVVTLPCSKDSCTKPTVVTTVETVPCSKGGCGKPTDGPKPTYPPGEPGHCGDEITVTETHVVTSYSGTTTSTVCAKPTNY